MGIPLRATLVALVLLGVLTSTACTDSSAVGDTASTQPASREHPGTWMSGASGPDVADGGFGDWRHEPVDIAGTWADTPSDSTEFYQLQAGGEYASWRGALDIAVGALGPGETWDAAASGAYDSRWTASLEKLKALRAEATGTTYIRFAHEMNGSWYPWKVTNANYRSFDKAWIRYRKLQQAIFPTSQLVFNLNRESVDTGMDWRGFFPGSRYVDVLSVDYYNQYPYVSSESSWKDSLDDVDSWGAPKGLDRYSAFAQSVGLPLAVSEWSGNADDGDSPAFVTNMLRYFSSHAGGGAGQIRYDVLFDVAQDDYRWNLYGKGARMPDSAAAYREFFKSR